MNTVEVTTDQGRIEVEARVIKDGLAVTMHPGDALDPDTPWRARWGVTHVASGRNVLGVWGLITHVRRAFKALLPLCDWEQTGAEIEVFAKGSSAFRQAAGDARKLAQGASPSTGKATRP